MLGVSSQRPPITQNILFEQGRFVYRGWLLLLMRLSVLSLNYDWLIQNKNSQSEFRGDTDRQADSNNRPEGVCLVWTTHNRLSVCLCCRLIPIGTYFLQGLCPWSPVVHIFSDNYICPLFLLIHMFSIINMTSSIEGLTRHIKKPKETTKYVSHILFCLFISTYKYTAYDYSLVLSRPSHPNPRGIFLAPYRPRYVSTGFFCQKRK